MIEKILAKASGKREVAPGEVVIAKVDLMVMHDLSANFVTRVFREELGGGSILDPSRIAFVFDHNFSPATEEAARTLHKVRRFAAEHESRICSTAAMAVCITSLSKTVYGRRDRSSSAAIRIRRSTARSESSPPASETIRWRRWVSSMASLVPRSRDDTGFLHGATREGVAPRDVAQYVVGHLGEDSAIYRAIEYAGPYIESLSIEDRMLFPLMSIDLGAKASFINPDDKTARVRASVFEGERFRNA